MTFATYNLPSTLADAFRLDGRMAVVTGAASGIGRQTALTLAEAGARLVVADVNETGLADTVEQIKVAGGEAHVVPTDVRQRESVGALAAAALELGSIDVWANVAGILRSASVIDTDEDTLESVFAVNVAGSMWGAAAAGRAMAERGRGSIINIASAAGEMAAPGGAVYGMSKAAVISLTRTLAVELGRQGVRVNAVAPGLIQTPQTAAFFERPEDSELPSDVPTRPLGTPIANAGQPLDVALCILYLASDASRFVTGQVLRPNGGMVLG
jgi:3-oxoacyl-[acyl-carrier protein] reductase